VLLDQINNLLPSVEHFRAGGYWIAFFAALLETTLGIGLILPGSTIILFLGALSSRGYLDVGDLVWFAVLGAIVGDNINYSLGRKYFHRWLQQGFWILKAGHVEKARQFMDLHGARSVFLGRFIPSIKEIVPFIAGSVRMNRKTFMFWNVLGAIGWGFEWVLAGYLFAQSFNLAELWLSRAGLLFAVLLLSGAVFSLCRWLIVRKGKQFLMILGSLWQSFKEAGRRNEHVHAWTEKHSRSLSFVRARFDPTLFSGMSLTILSLAFVYVLALFAGIVEDVLTSDPIVALDIRMANIIPLFRTAALTNIITWITLLGKSQVILFFVVISAALLSVWRKKYYILPLVTAAAGSAAFTYLGKLAFHRPRPTLAVYLEHSYSFPSGHATIAVAFYGFAAYLLMHFVRNWNTKINILFTALVLILAIGFSRIYLGVHYLSDIWSGYLIGTMWLIIGISFIEWRRYGKRTSQETSPVKGARPISAALVGTALLFYAGYSINYHPPRAAPPASTPVFIAQGTDIFRNEKLQYTETLFGRKQEPLNFIFQARDDNRLAAVLKQAGWTLTDKPGFSSLFRAVKALLAKKDYPAAPIAPSFWNTKIQNMSFAKVPGQSWIRNAHHIKIWRTNFLLTNGKRIYVSLVNANEGFKWGIMPQISPDLDRERESLYNELLQTGEIANHLKVQLVKPLVGRNFMGDQFFTDGRMYIIELQ
jgi:membrane protein DedA with SNARE-associated domain/membrane-associated phospholipid phosphatase